MPQTQPWKTSQIKQCKEKTGQAMLSDEHTLGSFSEDFGKISLSSPRAVTSPFSLEVIQETLSYAHDNQLPVTIRGKGLSQSGQALAPEGGLILSMEKMNRLLEPTEEGIWVEANASWSDVLDSSLQTNKIPYVLPYNCDLSIGGVISAGGVGASSFKYGTVTAHVKGLEVVLADGERHRVDSSSPLFHACLGGQGRFALITKACISLRPCKNKVRTFFLVYLDKESWFEDLSIFEEGVDFIESFCSPAIQGAKLSNKGRLPFAEWLYALHITLEYNDDPPELDELASTIKAWKVLHVQDEPIKNFLHRHDGRFAAMKLTGQWDLPHPWYECFVDKALLLNNLSELLEALPLYYATVVQLVPITKQNPTGFCMLPEADTIFALMILNPGVPSALVPGCLEAIQALDEKLLKQGGKRYLSGFLGRNLPRHYWKNHFGTDYSRWLAMKKDYDPKNIFQALLYQ